MTPVATSHQLGAHVPHTDTLCPSCGCHQPNGLLCHNDTLKIEQALRSVPELVEELAITLSRQTKMNNGGKAGKGSAHEKQPIHLGASDAAQALSHTLIAWSVGIGQPAWYATTAAARLLENVDAMRAHADADKLVAEITKVVNDARHHIDRAANRTVIPVGPCPETDHLGRECPGQVSAFIPTEDERPGRMQCNADAEHKWSSIQWLRAGKRILDTINKRKQQAISG